MLLIVKSGMCVWFIAIVFAHRDKKKIRHKFYQLMNSSPCNYITNITHIHMKKGMNINESIPVTITHVKENRKTVKEEEKELSVICRS